MTADFTNLTAAQELLQRLTLAAEAFEGYANAHIGWCDKVPLDVQREVAKIVNVQPTTQPYLGAEKRLETIEAIHFEWHGLYVDLQSSRSPEAGEWGTAAPALDDATGQGRR